MKKIWKGLIFLKRTNVPRSRVLMGFHHPDSITWRWSVWLNFGPNKIIWPIIFRQSSNGYEHVKIEIPFVGSLSINTQPPMWRTKGD